MTLSPSRRSPHPGPEAQPQPSPDLPAVGSGGPGCLLAAVPAPWLGLGLAGADPVGPEACPLPGRFCGPGEVSARPFHPGLAPPGLADPLRPAEPAHWHPGLGGPAGGQGAGAGAPGGGAALAAEASGQGAPERGGGVRGTPDAATFVIPKSRAASGSHSPPSSPLPLSCSVSEPCLRTSPLSREREKYHPLCWSSVVLCLGLVLLTLSLPPPVSARGRWGASRQLLHLLSADTSDHCQRPPVTQLLPCLPPMLLLSCPSLVAPLPGPQLPSCVSSPASPVLQPNHSPSRHAPVPFIAQRGEEAGHLGPEGKGSGEVPAWGPGRGVH